MTAPVESVQRSPDEELAAVNGDLAALLRCEPAPLVCGAERSLDDSLVICGILGGKDVGKSTLINALAQARVSPDEDEVGVGTTRPMAYVHRDVVSEYRRRFAGANGVADRLDVTEHDADSIRNAVLVDMPDFDSDLPDHLEIVSTVAPLLDRIIWVVTPKKIADRSWVDLFPRVIKDRQNVFCVLNKADELLGDEAYRNAPPDTFWSEHQDWMSEVVERVGCPRDGSRRFLLSALTPDAGQFVDFLAQRWGDPDWSVNGADRPLVEEIGRRLAGELTRLRGAVLAPVDRNDAAALKRANRRTELGRNIATVKSHFDLAGWSGRLDRACDTEYHQSVLNEVFGAEYCDVVGAKLRAVLRRETDVADEVLSHRVGHWPLLRSVYWPLRWLIRRIGGRIAGTQERRATAADVAFDSPGQSLSDRLSVYGARMSSDHHRVGRRFGLAERFPEPDAVARRIGTAAGSMLAALDQSVVDSLRDAYRRPWFWQRWLPLLVLVWFPVAQPLAQGLLELSDGSELSGLRQLVRALSAPHLLTGLAVVLVVYVVMLAMMFARCVVAVRELRRPSSEDASTSDRSLIVERLDELLVREAVGSMSRPYLEARDTLASLRQRLDRLSSVP